MFTYKYFHSRVCSLPEIAVLHDCSLPQAHSKLVAHSCLGSAQLTMETSQHHPKSLVCPRVDDQSLKLWSRNAKKKKRESKMNCNRQHGLETQKRRSTATDKRSNAMHLLGVCSKQSTRAPFLRLNASYHILQLTRPLYNVCRRIMSRHDRPDSTDHGQPFEDSHCCCLWLPNPLFEWHLYFGGVCGCKA